MAWRIGLHLGDVFAEATARRDGESRQGRWFLPQSSLGKGLKQFCEANGITEIEQFNVSHKIVPQIMQRRLGASPAFLVTSGFENWLEMNLPVQPEQFSLTPRKGPSPIDRDLVFGLSERVSATGRVEKAVDMQELEFLVSKLQMLNIKQLAVGLLHAQKNPTNEQMVADFFRQKGFRVFSAIELAGHLPCEEKQRWWTAYLDAFLTPVYEEMWKTVETQIREVGPDAKVIDFAQSVPERGQEMNSVLAGVFSTAWSLYRGARKTESKKVLYCGIEDFYLLHLDREPSAQWNSNYGTVRLTVPPVLALSVQPDLRISKGFWGCASFDEQRLGFEPGPMCFGKGLHPCFLDVLFAEGHLDSATALQDRLVTKTRARIIETLSAYSRDETSPVDFQKLPQHVLDLALLQLTLAIDDEVGRISLSLQGPLASSLLSPLKSRLGPQLRLGDDEGFVLSRGLVEE